MKSQFSRGRNTMPEILEIEQAEEIEQKQETTPKWNSWVVEVPLEIIEAQHLFSGTKVSITIKNNQVEAELINPSTELDKFVERIVQEQSEYFEEMKRLGD